MVIDFWKHNVEFITSCVALLAALFAIIGVASWRQTFVGRRKIKLAQIGLSLFYKAEDAIWEIRSVRKSRDDTPRPNKRSWETSELSYFADEMHWVEQKYLKHTNLFLRIETMGYKFMSIFGKESQTPFILQGRAVELLRDEIRSLWDRFDYLEGKYGQSIPEDEIERVIEDYRWVVDDYRYADDKISKYVIMANEAMESLAKEAHMLVNYKRWIRGIKNRFKDQPILPILFVGRYEKRRLS